MADKEEGNETGPRGADWEVVSLTASTYAAAPGPDIPKGEVDKNALFMSGHFVFPPSQHENLPLESEILGDSESIKEEGEKSCEDNWNIGKLTEPDEIDGKGNRSTIADADLADSTTLNLAGKEQSIYNSAEFNLLHSMGESNIENEDRVLAESALGSDAPKHTEKEDNYAAWWRKQAASLYAHAKEANTFWSIFIAAAVMGLVIIGQQWQQERWQLLHHKWHAGVYDEKFGRMVGRFKDAIVGGNRRFYSVRGRDH